MMDIKESIKKLIKESTELLQKLEEDEDSSIDIDTFDKIIEDSKIVSTQFKSKRSRSQHNGNKSSEDDSRSQKIKLVPIEKLIANRATTVLQKSCIELSDSDNEAVAECTKPKTGDNLKTGDNFKTSKASILKSVFSPSKEIASKNHQNASSASLSKGSTPKNHQNASAISRSCKVNLKRVDLIKLAVSNGLELMPTVSDRPTTTKSSKTVRVSFLLIRSSVLTESVG